MSKFEDVLKEVYKLGGRIWYKDEILPKKNSMEEEINRLIIQNPVLDAAQELLDACQSAFDYAINDPVSRLDQIQLKKLNDALIKAKRKV